MTREEEIRNRYERELKALYKEQTSCNHDWDEVKFDPEIVEEPRYETVWRGVDCWPEIVGYTKKRVDRWSRTCKKCGKVEYTHTQKAIQYKPDFS